MSGPTHTNVPGTTSEQASAETDNQTPVVPDVDRSSVQAELLASHHDGRPSAVPETYIELTNIPKAVTDFIGNAAQGNFTDANRANMDLTRRSLNFDYGVQLPEGTSVLTLNTIQIDPNPLNITRAFVTFGGDRPELLVEYALNGEKVVQAFSYGELGQGGRFSLDTTSTTYRDIQDTRTRPHDV
jgi:hypothetical protein